MVFLFATLGIIVLVAFVYYVADGYFHDRRFAWTLAICTKLALTIGATVRWNLPGSGSPTKTLAITEDASVFKETLLDLRVSRTLTAKESTSASVAVINTSAVPWRSTGTAPVHVGFQWVDSSDTRVSEGRGSFAGQMSPGSKRVLTFTVVAPTKPGVYKLIVDMIVEGDSWFESHNQRPISQLITVS
ncbi:MAG: hypothetical protein NVSMB64_27190 [Candidatus Velthaea sp.]